MKQYLLAVATLSLFGLSAHAQQFPSGFANPSVSQAPASSISAAAIVEMPLDGTGSFPMTWAGVAQYGHGPVQLVVELPRANKWMGVSCLKFLPMRKQGDAYVAATGGYVFTYESSRLAESGSYGNRPDPNRFTQFERALTIQQEDSVWEASVRMQGTQRTMRWTNPEGQVQSRQDVVSAMKPLQQTPHCGI